MKKKHIEFIRFGNLNLVKQKGYDPNGTGDFHTPPARYGIYAFPEYSICRFLISGDRQVSRAIKLDINELEWDENCLLTSKSRKEVKRLISNKNTKLKYVSQAIDGTIYAHENPKKFKYTKELWHHLKVDDADVIRRNNDWVLTTYKVWLDAYYAMLNYERNYYYKNGMKFAKDHHEVFIPHKI